MGSNLKTVTTSCTIFRAKKTFTLFYSKRPERQQSNRLRVPFSFRCTKVVKPCRFDNGHVVAQQCGSPVGVEQALDVAPGLGVGRRRQAARGDGPAAHAQHQPQPRAVADAVLAQGRRVLQLLQVVQQVLLGHRDTCANKHSSYRFHTYTMTRLYWRYQTSFAYIHKWINKTQT